MTWLLDQAPWFSFVVHPRDIHDLEQMPGSSVIRRHSSSDEEFVAKAMSSPPLVLHDIAFPGTAVRGEIVGTPRLPDTILTPDGHRAVVEAVKLAVGRGAPVIGLGALTAPATAGGRALLKHVPPGVTITNGNGLTAAIVHENVREAAEAIGLGERASVAVLGATGSVGNAVAGLLARDAYELTLVGPERERVVRMFERMRDRVAVGEGVAALGEADVVAVLTSHSSARLAPCHVKEGAVVIDVAQPCNVEPDDIPAFEERGVRVVRGGSVRIPGYSCRQDFRLRSAADTFACLAETCVLACEGLREHAVGLATADYAARIHRIARRHGIVAVPLELNQTEEEMAHA